MSLISEALVATTGFIEPKPITPEDVRMAEALLVSLSMRARGFIQLEQQRPFEMQRQRDVMATRDLLKTTLTDTYLADLIVSIDPLEGADYRETLETAREIALGAFPLTEFGTISGPVEVPPGDDDSQEWLAVLAVLDDVERMIDELEMFCLTAGQVTRFKLVYPELHAFMKQVFDEEMANQMVAAPGWCLSEDKESALRVFLGLEAEQAIRPRPPKLPMGKPTSADDAKDSSLSAGQRAQYR